MTLGQVLKGLAKRKKLPAYRIAQQLGVYPTTVYDWWKDEYPPRPENLAAYAALMETTVGEIRALAAPPEERRQLAEQLFAVLRQISEGTDPVQAFITVTGALVPCERTAALKGAAVEFKAYLSAVAGLEWDQLPLPEREAVLEQFRQELLAALSLPTSG